MHQVRALELLSFCFWLLNWSAIILGSDGPGVIKVVVKEGSDAVLRCSPSPKEDITAKIFDWRKVGQKDPKEVFMYDSGIHYNNGRPGQDEQFKGRVAHFQDQLMNGNASIKITDTKMADSGNYSCDFPRLQPRQTFSIELVVVPTFKDRSEETPGACPKPYIELLNGTKDGLLLQCEVRGASLEPKVMWQDSAGKILPAEEPQVSGRGGSYYVTLKTTVTKTDRYRCVATQEDIGHWTDAETYVPVYEDPSTKVVIGGLFGAFILGALVLAAVQAVLVATKCITVICNGDSPPLKMPRPDDPDLVMSDPHPPDDPETAMLSKSPLSNGGASDPGAEE